MWLDTSIHFNGSLETTDAIRESNVQSTAHALTHPPAYAALPALLFPPGYTIVDRTVQAGFGP
jgi:hypothetical protein